VERLAGQVDSLAEVCKDMDRRLVRLEAKFELLERAALARPRQLRDKAE